MTLQKWCCKNDIAKWRSSPIDALASKADGIISPNKPLIFIAVDNRHLGSWILKEQRLLSGMSKPQSFRVEEREGGLDYFEEREEREEDWENEK